MVEGGCGKKKGGGHILFFRFCYCVTVLLHSTVIVLHKTLLKTRGYLHMCLLMWHSKPSKMFVWLSVDRAACRRGIQTPCVFKNVFKKQTVVKT